MALTKIGKEGITGISNSSDATAITIDSSENVGIGTSSPDRILHLNNSGTEQNVRAKFTNGTTGEGASDGFEIGINASNPAETVLVNYEASPMAFFTNASERMRIDSNGKLLVGATTNTTARIVSVADLSSMHTCTFQNSANNTGNIFLRQQNYLGQDCGNITQTGATTVSYGTSSDYRLKENVVYNFDATTRLKKLKPCRFNFIADGADKVVDGFLAHEVANDADDNAIVPEAIVGQKDAVDDDGNPILQQIDQSKIVPLLVKTIQELEARITALENS